MKKNRHKLDAYYTAQKLTEVLIDKVLSVYALPEATFLEPCNGVSSISNEIEKVHDWSVERWDIDPKLEEDGYIDKVCDASHWLPWTNVNVDWVVSNPPYTQPQCQQIIQHSFDHVRCGIAMLLRLSYDEPCAGRAEFLQNTLMSHQIIFNPRPQFKGTDNVTSCWFVWLKEDFAKDCGITQTEKVYVTDWRG